MKTSKRLKVEKNLKRHFIAHLKSYKKDPLSFYESSTGQKSQRLLEEILERL